MVGTWDGGRGLIKVSFWFYDGLDCSRMDGTNRCTTVNTGHHLQMHRFSELKGRILSKFFEVGIQHLVTEILGKFGNT